MRFVALSVLSAALLLACNPAGIHSPRAAGLLPDNFSVPDYAQVVLGDEPLAFYRLNETSGTVAHDSSNNALNGTYGADVALKTAGLLINDPDTAAGFNGGDDSTANYVRVAKSSTLQPTAAITVEAWVKPAAAGTSVALLSYGTDSVSPWQPYILRLDGTQITFQVALNGTVTALTSQASLTLGQTYHVVGTYSGSKLSVYINGALDSTLAATGAISNYSADTTSGLGIGHRYNDTATQDVLDGTLGQVAIYGSALSAARVLAHYQVGTGLPLYSEVVLSDSPSGYFRLNEGSGTTVHDSSTNGLKGTYGADVKLGATGLVIDDPDNAVALNGGSAATTNYIQVPKTTDLQPTSAISVECWVSPTADGVAVALLSYGTDAASPWQPYILGLSGTQITFQLVLGSSQSLLTSKANLTLGKTYHVVGTYNGTTQALYINGELDSSMAATGAISNYNADTTSGLGIGHRYNAYSPQAVLDGTLAQVAIYPSALSPTRVLAHYQTGTGVVSGESSASTTSSSVSTTSSSGTTGGKGGTTGSTTSGSGSTTSGGSSCNGDSSIIPEVPNSTFCQSVPSSPKLASNSAAILSFYADNGLLPQNFDSSAGDGLWYQFGATGSEATLNEHAYSTRAAIFYAKTTDPEYTVSCSEPWSSCGTMQGAKLNIPNGATSEGGFGSEGESHMVVIDPTHTYEYDFIGASSCGSSSSSCQGGGTFHVAEANRFTLSETDGWGCGSDSTGCIGTNTTASGRMLTQGLVDPQELLNGAVNHALSFTLTCSNSSHVAPATAADYGCPQGTANALAEGQKIFVNASDATIDGWSVPTPTKVILKAMAHYGLYFTDTLGSTSWVGLYIETIDPNSYFNVASPIANNWPKVGTTYSLGAYPNGGLTDFGFDLDFRGVPKNPSAPSGTSGLWSWMAVCSADGC